MKKGILLFICILLICGLTFSVSAGDKQEQLNNTAISKIDGKTPLTVTIKQIPVEDSPEVIHVYFNGGWGAENISYLFKYRVTFTNVSRENLFLDSVFKYTTPNGEVKYGAIDGGAPSRNGVGYIRPIAINAGQTLTYDYGWVGTRSEFPGGQYSIEVFRNGTKLGEASVAIKDLNKNIPPEQTVTTPGTYFKYQPKVEKDDLNQDMYLLEGNYYVKIGPYSPTKKEAGRFDRSPTLFLVEKNNGTFITRYRSSHSGDSYILRPSFYKTISKDDPIIILAAVGTEYTWGARVFFWEGNNMKDVGDLNVGAITPGRHSGVSSIIPYTQINKTGEQIQFRFTTDVLYDLDGKEEKSLSKDSIKYIYENGKLRVEIKQ